MTTSAAQAAGEMPSEPEAEKMWKYFNDRVRGKTAGEYGPFTNMDWHAAVTLRAHAEALQAQRDKAMREADAMEEFLGAAAKREKEASAIIESLAADIHITVPLRDYTEMSPKDCYELGMMDGVAALKAQINAAIDAAMKKECGK